MTTQNDTTEVRAMKTSETLHDVGTAMTQAREAFEAGDMDVAYIGYCVVRDLTRGALRKAAEMRMAACNSN